MKLLSTSPQTENSYFFDNYSGLNNSDLIPDLVSKEYCKHGLVVRCFRILLAKKNNFTNILNIVRFYGYMCYSYK